MNCQQCQAEEYDPLKAACRGRTAFPGCVEGIVCVITQAKDVQKIMLGQILVTPMTDPDSLPAIERAAAVVTDRGGILCHAAIVCREIGKPCVVGTGNSTEKLQDGHRVRVCATDGLVFVLS